MTTARIRRLAVVTALALGAVPGAVLAGAPPAGAETPPATLTLATTLRDFLYQGTTVPGRGSPDFEGSDTSGVTTGLVQPTLGDDGTPAFRSTGNGSIASPASFGQWYHDTPGTNVTVQQPLTLTLQPGSSPALYTYSSNAFFPLDGEGWNDPSYGHPQVSGGCDGKSHNFSFTQQIHTSFTYQGAQTFSFQGDDDVWVFINRQLVIDLGGLHTPASGSVTLDGTRAAQLGLTVGGTYPLDVFTAERRTCGSDFILSTTLALKPALTITPDDQVSAYGDPDPAFTYTVQGLQPGDSLATPPSCGVAGAHTDVGTYPITCFGAVVSDPDVRVDESGTGTLTVQRAATHLDPAAILAALGPDGVTITLGRLSARLLLGTAGGRPAPAGSVLTFAVGGRTVCTATTDATGTASCPLTLSQTLAAVTSGRYTVSFAGNPNLLPSTATGTGITYRTA